MCGIVGYVGYKEASTVLLNGLKRLEYRGYDSAGIASWSRSPTRPLRPSSSTPRPERWPIRY
jgi:glucosamine--fructose-6-phosphate aminotransferase (isomerizing)